MNILNKTVQDLITEGIITQAQIEELIKKSKRKAQRAAKKARAEIVKTTVSEKLTDLLSQPGATVKHRKVWESVGRVDYTRDEILNSLRSLRDEGVLQNIRTSGNNFQVFWAYVKQPEAAAFGTLDEIDES